MEVWRSDRAGLGTLAVPQQQTSKQFVVNQNASLGQNIKCVVGANETDINIYAFYPDLSPVSFAPKSRFYSRLK